MTEIKTETKRIVDGPPSEEDKGCGGAEHAERALTPVARARSHKSLTQYTPKESVYTDYSQRQPMTDIEVQCTDGVVYFYSCLFEYIEVIRDAIIDGKASGQIKIQCTVETANNLLNIIRCRGPKKTLHVEQVMNVYDVLHRYNGVNYYIACLPAWCGQIPRALISAVAKYRYDMDALVFMQRNDIPVECHNDLPIEWYESMMHYNGDFEFESCVCTVLTHVLPHTTVDIKYIEKLAERICEMTYEEYHEVVPVLYRLPNTESVPVLFDELQDLLHDKVNDDFLLWHRDRLELTVSTAAGEAKHMCAAEEKFVATLQNYGERLGDIDDNDPRESIFNPRRQRITETRIGMCDDVHAEFESYLQETKADDSVLDWIVGAIRRNLGFIGFTNYLHPISHEGLVPYCQRASVVAVLDLFAASRITRSSLFKLARG